MERNGPAPPDLRAGRRRFLARVSNLGIPTTLSVKKYAKIPNLTDPACRAARSADSVVAGLCNRVGRDMGSPCP